MSSNSSKPAKQNLERRLGLFDSTMMMTGIVIGSGIFLTTGIMAEALPSAGWILIAWAAGGLLTLAGALTYAELGASMPEAGGQYVYLREAFGPLSGFLFGWILFLVSMGGSIAALGVGFAEYFGYFVPAMATDNYLFSIEISESFTYSMSAGQIVAVAVIIFLSIFNYIGVGYGKVIQNVVTVIKIGSLLLLIILGISFGSGISPGAAGESEISGMSFWGLTAAFGVALVSVTWAFDGWNNLNYAAGEIKNPGRNLPFALVIGTILITVLYVLANYVYTRALTIQEMSGVVRIAETAVTSLFGGAAGGIMSAAVLISIFGALNGAIFVGPRVYYAMAEDRLFFKKTAEIHPKFKTPAFAILIQAVWACLLTVTGSFEQLFTYVVFVTILFYILSAAAVFTLRKKQPDLPRPYKTWGYPYVPLIFIIVSTGILINTLIERPVESIAGLGFLVIGVPVYYYWKNKSGISKTSIT